MNLKDLNRLSSSITGRSVSRSGQKLGVRISKETGGAYADMGEVIESELAKIREWTLKKNKVDLPSNNNERTK